MPFIRKKISWMSSREMLFCALLLPTAIVLTAFGLVRERASATAIASSESAGLTASAAGIFQSNLPGARLEAERVTLRATGFEPAEINRPAGRFLLALNDRSGLAGITLTVVDGSGRRVYTSRLRDNPRKHEWRQVVNLPPGRYVLSEASHPEWTCRITLTSN